MPQTHEPSVTQKRGPAARKVLFAMFSACLRPVLVIALFAAAYIFS